MTCPKCHSDFEEGPSVCPECGIRLTRNISGVMKTSAVMIATSGGRGFYRSVQDVPEPLRTRLIETTSSSNSGTIVIADKAGKEQLTQVLARREAPSEHLTARSGAAKGDAASAEPSRKNLPMAGAVSKAEAERARRSGVQSSFLERFFLKRFALNPSGMASALAWAGFILVLALSAVAATVFGLRW